MLRFASLLHFDVLDLMKVRAEKTEADYLDWVWEARDAEHDQWLRAHLRRHDLKLSQGGDNWGERKIVPAKPEDFEEPLQLGGQPVRKLFS